MECTLEGVWYGDAAWRPTRLRAAAAEEKLWRVSPKMKKGVPRVNEEPVSCTSGWAVQSWLRGVNVSVCARVCVHNRGASVRVCDVREWRKSMTRLLTSLVEFVS